MGSKIARALVIGSILSFVVGIYTVETIRNDEKKYNYPFMVIAFLGGGGVGYLHGDFIEARRRKKTNDLKSNE